MTQAHAVSQPVREAPRGGVQRVAGLDRDRESVILNKAFMVRHYGRGARSSIHARERAAALLELGLAVREALIEARSVDDVELVLGALVDGLAPREERRF